MQRSPLARILVRLLFLAGGLVLAALAAERVIRAADLGGISYYTDAFRYFSEGVRMPEEAKHESGRIFENRPGVDVRYETFRFVTNGFGLRSGQVDDGFRPERDGTEPRSTRLLFLGDSVTFAWGVDDADSWVRALEREGGGVGGKPLECLNAGHPHYDTVQEADWLATHGPALRPDAVVLTYVVNDLESTWETYTDSMRLAEAAQASGAQPGFFEARLPQWFRGLYGIVRLFGERRDARRVAEEGPVVVEERPEFIEGWPGSEAALGRVRELCAALEAPLIVFDHSTPRIPALQRWCEANDVPYYDFTFQEEDFARGITNSLADPHANPLGNRLLADKALAALRDQGLLAP